MPLTEAEKRELVEQFKAEVAEKYRKRAAEYGPSEPIEEDPAAVREAEIQALRQEVLDQFHRSNNFIRHVSSSGEEEWLSPDEYEAKRKRRRRRKQNVDVRAKRSKMIQRYVLFAIGLLAAVALGWVMGKP